MSDAREVGRVGSDLTVLSSAGPRLTKRWAADGSIIASEHAWQMRTSTLPAGTIVELHASLTALATSPRCAVIRGRYIGDAAAAQGRQHLVEQHNAARASRGQSAVKLLDGFVPRVSGLFVDQVSTWLMLDVDNYLCHDVDPNTDPANACRAFMAAHLPQAFHDRSFVYQLSASAGHPRTDSRQLKAHLWFVLERPGYSSAQLRAWAEACVPGIDRSVLSATQLHYTAAPALDDGVVDPIAGRRLGLVLGQAGDVVPLTIEPNVLARARKGEGDRAPRNDPRDKPGIIGAYCRAVECRDLAQRHPAMFDNGRDADHFTWLGSPSGIPDGVFVTPDGLHLVCVHGTAPTGQNRAANAYDFDRQFLFGDLDADLEATCAMRDRPSVRAMRDWVAEHHPDVLQDIQHESSAEIDFAGLDEEHEVATETMVPSITNASPDPAVLPPRIQPAPGRGSRGQLKIWSPAELRDRAPTRWLIQGWLPEKGLCVLFGDSNIGKSFAALDMAMAVSLGHEWHGNKVQQGGALYIAAEGGHGFGRRFDAYAVHYGMDLEGVPIGLIDEGLDLRSNATDTDRAIAACREFAQSSGKRLRIVVLDTLARMMSGGNENSPDDMGKLIAAAGRISDALDALVLLVHHCGKDESRGARGHSSLRAAADTEIEARLEGGTTRVLQVTKQRDGARDLRTAFKLETVVTGVDPEGGSPITSALAVPVEPPPKRTPRERPLSRWQQYVISAVDDAQGFDDEPPTAEAVQAAAARIIRREKGELPNRWDYQFERAAQGLVSSGRLTVAGGKYLRSNSTLTAGIAH